MAKFTVSADAKEDLFQISDYIRDDSRAAADRVIEEIVALLNMLAQSPRLGRTRPELGTGVRSLSVGNYVVFLSPRA